MKITVTIPATDADLIRQFLAANQNLTANTHGALTLQTLAALLLEDVALMMRRPGSWEGSNMATVLQSHGYEAD